MARTLVTEFQRQIEAVRHEAFAAGYAAAMDAVFQLASLPARQVAGSAVSRNRGNGRGLGWAAREAAPVQEKSVPRRRTARAGVNGQITGAGTRSPRSEARRMPRGTNAQMIEEILKEVAPRALRPTEIRKALLQTKRISVSFPSIGNALGQLAARNGAEQVGDSKTWRSPGTSKMRSD